MSSRSRFDAGFVYVAQCGLHLKIGFTTADPHRRMQMICTGLDLLTPWGSREWFPGMIIFRGAFRALRYQERQMHAYLKRSGFPPYRGEWWTIESRLVRTLLRFPLSMPWELGFGRRQGSRIEYRRLVRFLPLTVTPEAWASVAKSREKRKLSIALR